MRLSEKFIKDAKERYGWVDRLVPDYTPRKVKLEKDSVLPVMKDAKGYILDDAGNDKTLDNDVFVDADSAAVALALTLRSRDPRMHEVLKRTLRYPEDMSVNTTACAAGAETFSWKQEDSVYEAEFIGDNGKVPMVEITGEEIVHKNKNIGLGYSVTRIELRKMILLGVPIRNRKVNAVGRGFAEKDNAIAYLGSTVHGETGLLNDAYVTASQAPMNAGVTSRSWADKTMQEIYDDAKTQFQTIFEASEGAISPNRYLVPIAYKSVMDQKFDASSGITDTLRQAIEKGLTDENGNSLKIAFRTECATAGTGSTKMACMYNDGVDSVEFVKPMDVTSYPEEWSGLTSEVPSETETVGTVIYRPISFNYMYGI